MRSWSMGRKLFVGTGLLVLMAAVSGVQSSFALADMQRNMDKVSGSLTERLMLAVIISENNRAAFLAEKSMLVNALVRNPELTKQWREEEPLDLRKLVDTANQLKPMLALQDSRDALDRINARVAEWDKQLARVNQLAETGRAEQAQALSLKEIKPLYEAINNDATRVEGNARRLMEETRQQELAQATSTRFFVIGILVFVLAVGALVIWQVRSVVRMLRNTVAELSDGGEQVASASSQIATASQSLSQGASSQAAALQEVSASMEEMTAMTRRTSENSTEAMSMMSETVTLVDRSNHALREMVTSMDAIKSSSEKVAKINKTIDEIAFQTNILALNAAVEAARAGEAGMGFAVVADEVRNLAQRSAVAAKDTALLIEEAISNSNQGALKLGEVATAIQAITDSAGKVKNLVDEVNEASKQQATGINQVSTALTQASKGTQTAAANAEESAAASEELSAQAETVRALGKTLEVLVQGGSAQASHHNAAGKAPRIPLKAEVTHASIAHDEFPMDDSGGSFKQF